MRTRSRWSLDFAREVTILAVSAPDGQKLSAGRYTYRVQAFTRDLPGMYAGPVTVKAGSGGDTTSEAAQP